MPVIVHDAEEWMHAMSHLEQSIHCGVHQAALRAKESGSTRFCMGAAWRGPSQVGKGQWERVLEMVSRIRGLGMEVLTAEPLPESDIRRMSSHCSATCRSN